MTRVNSKVKIHVVDELFVGVGFVTDVWMTDKAAEAFDEFRKKGTGVRSLKKLEHYATNGFRLYTGNKRPIRHEWDEVYRIAFNRFRLIGFYEEGAESFIVIDAFKKRGMQLTEGHRKRIDEVATVKRYERWRKRR